MNGHKSGAFCRALTDAVLEEYGGDEQSVKTLPSPVKASKRGRGNSFSRAVKYAILAAVLMTVTIGSALATPSLSDARYPAKEAEEAHYVNLNAGKQVEAKTVIERIYRPLDIPFRFVMETQLIKDDLVYITWVDYHSPDAIFFTQAPLKHTYYNDPEDNIDGFREMLWEKCNINGFEVIIFYKGPYTEYWWNDGEYFFKLEFEWNDSTKEDRYRVFESISIVDEVKTDQ